MLECWGESVQEEEYRQEVLGRFKDNTLASYDFSIKEETKSTRKKKKMDADSKFWAVSQ